MRPIFFLFLALFSWPFLATAQNQGDLIDHQLMFDWSIQEVQDEVNNRIPIGLPDFLVNLLVYVDYPLKGYRVSYYTADYDGNVVPTQGFVIFPQNYGCPLSVAAYCHGTVFDEMDVPSNMSGAGDGGEFVIGLALGGAGYAVALPDYLGLGDGPDVFHPYVEEETQANATVDILRATNHLANLTGTALRNEYFISGYSQGGHAGMSALRSILEDTPNEFNVRFAGLGSGPYDLSVTQFNYLFENPLYPNPEFALYVAASCQETFGNLYSDPGDFLIPPYDQFYEDEVLNQTGNVSWIPQPWQQIFVPSFLTASATPSSPLRQCLAESDVYDWFDYKPTTMYYCTQDEQVDFNNSLKAKTELRNNIPWWLFWLRYQINTVNSGAFDHFTCAFPSLLFARTSFNLYRSACNGAAAPDMLASRRVEEMGIAVPHQLFYDADITWDPKQIDLHRIELMDLQERVLREWEGDALQRGRLTIYRGELPAGIYGLRFQVRDRPEVYGLLAAMDIELATSSQYDPISPNPMQEESLLDLSLLDEEVLHLSIYTENGGLLRRWRPEAREARFRILREDLRSGRYHLEVRTRTQSYFLPLDVEQRHTTQGDRLGAYPNPMRSSTLVDLTPVKGSIEAAVLLDMQGKVVRTYQVPEEGRGQLEILRNGLQAGVYVLQIQSSQEVYSLKLILD